MVKSGIVVLWVVTVLRVQTERRQEKERRNRNRRGEYEKLYILGVLLRA